MPSEFSKLPKLSWRGQSLPIAARSVSFAHESVQHKLQRRNQDLIEQTGAHNLVFTYTVPMRSGIFKGEYGSKLFGEGLQKLFRACRDKTPGILVDPVYGQRRAVCSSYNDDTDLGRTDGVDIRLEFTDAPEDGDDDTFNFPTFNTAKDSQKKTSQTVVKIARPDPTKPETAALKKRTTNLGDALIQYQNFGVSTVNELKQSSYQAKRVEDIVTDALKNAVTRGTADALDLFGLQQAARRQRDDAIRAQKNDADQARAKVIINAITRSLTSIAATYGVSVESLIAANPDLAKKPSVPVGAVVKIPRE